AVETPIWKANRDVLRSHAEMSTLLRRPGQAYEIAQSCLMLAVPGYVTAQVLVVGGGMRFRVPRSSKPGVSCPELVRRRAFTLALRGRQTGGLPRKRGWLLRPRRSRSSCPPGRRDTPTVRRRTPRRPAPW